MCHQVIYGCINDNVIFLWLKFWFKKEEEYTNLASALLVSLLLPTYYLLLTVRWKLSFPASSGLPISNLSLICEQIRDGSWQNRCWVPLDSLIMFAKIWQNDRCQDLIEWSAICALIDQDHWSVVMRVTEWGVNTLTLTLTEPMQIVIRLLKLCQHCWK